MSNVTVEINGKETVSEAARNAGSSIKTMGDNSKGIFDDIVVTAGDVVGAVQRIASTVGSFFTKYAEQQKAITTFGAAIAQSSQLSDGAASRLREYAGAMALKTGADDEAILSMMSFMATSGRTEDQIRKVIAAAADMSTVTGKDLKTSVEQINKTFSGSAKELGSFVGGMKGLSEEELKSGAGVDLIAKKYGGLADAMGGSASVALGNLQNTFDDTKAALGEALMPAVQPTLEWLVGFLNDTVIPAVKNIAPIVKDVFQAVQQFITDMKPAIEPILKWFGEVWTLTIGPNVKSIVDIVKSTLTLVSALFNGDWKTAWDSAKKIVTDVIDIISRAFQPIITSVNAVVTGIETALQKLGLLQAKQKTDTKYVTDKSGKIIGYYDENGKYNKYASGTKGAAPGVALVGELGPELVVFNGGEQVIPNDKLPSNLGGVRGYALGTLRGGSDSEGDDSGGGAGLSIFEELALVLKPVITQLGGMFTALESIQAILNPLQTIFSAMMDVLGPLINTVLAPIVGILRVVGTTLGQMLAPIISALGPIINALALGFVWLYNNAIVPFANAVITAGNWLYNGIAKVVNFLLGWLGVHMDTVALNNGALSTIHLASLSATGSTSYSGTTGSAATYEKPRDITVNVEVNTSALVGDDGVSQFALIIGRELKAAGVLGVA